MTIDSMQGLHDFVSRYRTWARYGADEGYLALYGSAGVGIRIDGSPGRLPIPDDALLVDGEPRLELRNLAGDWVPLAEWDERAIAERIERFEALNSFDLLAKNYNELVEKLERAWERLHPKDRGNLWLEELPMVDRMSEGYIKSIVEGARD